MIDLFTPGAYARTAGGNQEIPDAQKQAVSWISWSINPDNGMDGDAAAWGHARGLWDASGLGHFPWLHCRTLADINRLISVGEANTSPAIGCNIEDIQKDFLENGVTTGDIAQALSRWQKPIHMATLPWVQNSVEWRLLARAVVALEIFPDEQQNIFPDGYDPVLVGHCIEHAFMLGLKNVTLMFKTKGYTKESFGDEFSICHSLYTADDITPSMQGWAAWKGSSPCVKPVPPTPPPDPMPEKWWEKPYPKGDAVGPEKLPRVFYPPSSDKGVFRGPGVLAMKRGISRAQRWAPWDPQSWDAVYWEKFAKGKGTSKIGDSGVRGFQRQEWRDQPAKQSGVLNDETYQRMRRARIPVGTNKGKPILDAEAIRLLNLEVKTYGPDAKLKAIRDAIADFCVRAEEHESRWHYTRDRPYTGLGVEPEKTHYNDCSSYAILAYYWAGKQTGHDVPDPSGYSYEGYGNTWDDLDGHPYVTTGDYLVGDLAHYDGHVTICRRAGDYQDSVWSSFGTEAGPQDLPLHYRGDFRFVVRPPIIS